MSNLLERKVEKKYGLNRGASVAGMVMAIIVAIIMIFGAGVPITAAVVTAANLSGLNATLAGLCTTLLVLMPSLMILQALG